MTDMKTNGAPPTLVGRDVACNADGSPACLSGYEIGDALQGAITIYDHESDNDTETMYLTLAGQYVRRTGEDADRFFVLEREDARDLAQGYVDDEDLDLLMP